MATCSASARWLLLTPCYSRNTKQDADASAPPLAFLAELDALIEQRGRERPAGGYTTKLFESGTRRIAQKVGEVGVETALAAVAEDGDVLLGESADLPFHLLVLLHAPGLDAPRLVTRLRDRHCAR